MYSAPIPSRCDEWGKPMLAKTGQAIPPGEIGFVLRDRPVRSRGCSASCHLRLMIDDPLLSYLTIIHLPQLSVKENLDNGAVLLVSGGQ